MMFDEKDRKIQELKQKYINAVADYETTMFEKEQLKKQLEELKSTNKVLSEELTKDKILKQDCLTTCCGIPIGDIPKLQDENKQLEDNWKKLKEWLVQLQKFKGINQQGFSWGVAQEVLDKMEEIEKNITI